MLHFVAEGIIWFRFLNMRCWCFFSHVTCSRSLIIIFSGRFIHMFTDGCAVAFEASLLNHKFSRISMDFQANSKSDIKRTILTLCSRWFEPIEFDLICCSFLCSLRKLPIGFFCFGRSTHRGDRVNDKRGKIANQFIILNYLSLFVECAQCIVCCLMRYVLFWFEFDFHKSRTKLFGRRKKMRHVIRHTVESWWRQMQTTTANWNTYKFIIIDWSIEIPKMAI